MRHPLLAAALAAALLSLAHPAAAQGVPQGRPGTFALTDCRIETVTRGVIERGTVVIADGRIAAVGPNVPIPPEAERIPCDGGTVYPGFIDGGTKMGLTEIGSLDETRDVQEIGAITPHMRALTAVNPSSIHPPIARVNGVTMGLTAPTGGLMPGTAALITFHGHTPQQMALGFEAVVVNFPSSARRGRFDRRSREERERQAREQRNRLTETWEQAKRFAELLERRTDEDPTPAYVPEMEALLPAVRGEAPLLVEANFAEDILAALEWARERDVRIVLMGALEGWRVADRIAEAGVPVIVGPVHTLPVRESDRYDRPFTNPGLLHAAGVQVALRTTALAQTNVQNVRNLPFQAAFAAAFGEEHGFGRQQALEAVTIVPARIFGVDDEVGSIEAGKRATLFVATGDPFETATQITHLFMDGYAVPLVSRHTQLYEEYLERVPGLVK